MITLIFAKRFDNEISFSYPCSEMDCDMEILEETDNCQIWTCYKYNPSDKKENYLTIVAIGAAVLSLLSLSLLVALKSRRNCRPESQPVDQSQESPEVVQDTAIENINCYFSIDSSSSSEYFEDNNLDLQTPIIRPRLRGPNVHQ